MLKDDEENDIGKLTDDAPTDDVHRGDETLPVKWHARFYMCRFTHHVLALCLIYFNVSA